MIKIKDRLCYRCEHTWYHPDDGRCYARRKSCLDPVSGHSVSKRCPPCRVARLTPWCKFKQIEKKGR